MAVTCGFCGMSVEGHAGENESCKCIIYLRTEENLLKYGNNQSNMEKERKHTEYPIRLLMRELGIYEAYTPTEEEKPEIDQRIQELRNGLTACNNHYQLLEALKDMVKVFGSSASHNTKVMSMERAKDVLEAIKQAEA